jgi:hypothetical protein
MKGKVLVLCGRRERYELWLIFGRFQKFPESRGFVGQDFSADEWKIDRGMY